MLQESSIKRGLRVIPAIERPRRAEKELQESSIKRGLRVRNPGNAWARFVSIRYKNPLLKED